MIGRLKGVLIHKQPPWLVIDVQGVGYELEAPMSTFYDLPELGREVSLFTHYAVKEDSVALYGFMREHERRLFREVQKVSGIGAKIALAILSGSSVDEFARLVQSGDVTALCRIPGIGKKTAERIVVELRDRAADLITGSVLFSGSREIPADPVSEASVALQQLGYKPAEISKMVKIAETGDSAEDGHGSKKLAPLVMGAIGVVFGDIGTSPLYTLKEAFGHAYGLHPDRDNVFGILSLVFWAMLLVVTIKYVMVVMRADNRGEGGILALMTVVRRSLPIASPMTYTVGILSILGTALFFGDAVITPAMSVLSAAEGFEVATPAFKPYVVPISIAVLLVLFAVQRSGTDKVGKMFGPVMIVWFIVLAVLGFVQIIKNPTILQALSPHYAVNFFIEHGKTAWLALGAVVLAVTGGEALYADMGHFGRIPIRYAWLGFVMPCLLLNYFGQGALVLASPEAVANPFYHMVPEVLLYPAIGLAMLATVIASQAVISGAFSLARQAVQLGYLPRLQLIHTSDETIGQVYVPWVNRILLIVVMILVVSFGTSSNLASAYGVSVTGAMLIDTILLMILASSRWGWPTWVIFVVGGIYFVMDTALFSANAVKFFHGAWVPFAITIVVFTIMRTWRRGRDLVREQVNRDSLRIEHFVQSVMVEPPVRVSGTAIFMTPSNDYMPPALLHNLKHNKVLHERNVFLSVETLSVPRADDNERVTHTDLGHGFARLTLRYGYMEDPDVPKALKRWSIPGPAFDPMDTTFFASRETLTANADQGMALWRDKLFLVMSRNATSATEFFGIPGNRLVELGTQVVI